MYHTQLANMSSDQMFDLTAVFYHFIDKSGAWPRRVECVVLF